MLQDTFFSGTRFVQLLRRDWISNKRTYGLKWLSALVILLFIFIVSLYGYYAKDSYAPHFVKMIWAEQVERFPYFLLFMSIAMSCSFMDMMQTKGQRVTTLMLPATIFEKFLLKWLLVVPVLPFVYLVTFELASLLSSFVLNVFFPSAPWVGMVPLSYIFPTSPEGEDIFKWIIMYFYIQSSYILGSTIWPNKTFVRTLSALTVIGATYFVVAFVLFVLIFPLNRVWFPNQPFFLDPLFLKTMMGLATCFNWGLAYLRFKESEIIDRW